MIHTKAYWSVQLLFDSYKSLLFCKKVYYSVQLPIGPYKSLLFCTVAYWFIQKFIIHTKVYWSHHFLCYRPIFFFHSADGQCSGHFKVSEQELKTFFSEFLSFQIKYFFESGDFFSIEPLRVGSWAPWGMDWVSRGMDWGSRGMGWVSRGMDWTFVWTKFFAD